MEYYHRKLYAFLQNPGDSGQVNPICSNLRCLQPYLSDLSDWWSGSNQFGQQAADIASSSDRVNLHYRGTSSHPPQARHPLSGQASQIHNLDFNIDISVIKDEEDAEKVFWWFWRFYPELLAQKERTALLFPAHQFLPDCPLHSYQSTVSALTGAMFPSDWQCDRKAERPYLFIFTFAPIQEFIKASRKFLDFWSGSYLLHYLSAKICWYIAKKYGPDSIITPCLWSQEIIDTLIIEDKYRDFISSFQRLQLNENSEPNENPVAHQLMNGFSTRLSTGGFVNAIATLVPGKENAQELGQELKQQLIREWSTIAEEVRKKVRGEVVSFLGKQPFTQTEAWSEEKLADWKRTNDFIKVLNQAFPNNLEVALQELKNLYKHGSNWEWKALWEAQIQNSWEPYWCAVPLGNPESEFSTRSPIGQLFDADWKQAQSEIAKELQKLPSEAEEYAYETLNVGTWWGRLQYRLGEGLRATKTLRNWQIPAAPGERSTISGQFSALHPQFNYSEKKFREGGGLATHSMQLFWLVMSQAFPGLFNGSERLNAIELTKRMAWVYGGVARSLGISTNSQQVDPENWIRFPNLSSIASARFACDRPDRVQRYWENLNTQILGQGFSREEIERFNTKTRRPSQVPKTDKTIRTQIGSRDGYKGYNGIMFSSKWLADEMGLLQKTDVEKLRACVETAHRQSNFQAGSPADWWAIVLGDGDGMGSYVSGESLKTYEEYLIDTDADRYRPNNLPSHSNEDDFSRYFEQLRQTKKRMGPATHIGFTRALLDFSNCLVPYLTETRFCGKVIYSGGDDIMAILPLEDLPEYLLSLRAAWCGAEQDPYPNHGSGVTFRGEGGYWHPQQQTSELPNRPLFTMGQGATISLGIVIAYKTIPLPTVLENLWEAEKVAKSLPGKDGLHFRAIYGGGNQLQATLKGHLLPDWWNFMEQCQSHFENLAPLLYRLAEELPQHACATPNQQLFAKAARVILSRRDESKKISQQAEQALEKWLNDWEAWVNQATGNSQSQALGTRAEDLGKLLRFSAFWAEKIAERKKWVS